MATESDVPPRERKRPTVASCESVASRRKRRANPSGHLRTTLIALVLVGLSGRVLASGQQGEYRKSQRKRSNHSGPL